MKKEHLEKEIRTIKFHVIERQFVNFICIKIVQYKLLFKVINIYWLIQSVIGGGAKRI